MVLSPNQNQKIINPIEQSPTVTQELSENLVLTTVDDLYNWARLSSLWPLLYGTACCFIEFAALIGSRFDFDRFGLVPRSSPRQADLLITAGCDPNAMNSWNMNAIIVGVLKNHFSFVRKILDYPSLNVNCKDNNGKTMLMTSLCNMTEESYSYIKLLLEEKGADPNIADLSGRTPLHHLCKVSIKSIIQANKTTSGSNSGQNAYFNMIVEGRKEEAGPEYQKAK